MPGLFGPLIPLREAGTHTGPMKKKRDAVVVIRVSRSLVPGDESVGLPSGVGTTAAQIPKERGARGNNAGRGREIRTGRKGIRRAPSPELPLRRHRISRNEPVRGSAMRPRERVDRAGDRRCPGLALSRSPAFGGVVQGDPDSGGENTGLRGGDRGRLASAGAGPALSTSSSGRTRSRPPVASIDGSRVSTASVPAGTATRPRTVCPTSSRRRTPAYAITARRASAVTTAQATRPATARRLWDWRFARIAPSS